MYYQLILLFVLANSFAAAADAATTNLLFSLTPPSKDPFYTSPTGLENAQPGEILAIRKAPASLANVFIPVKTKNIWQFLVRTEDNFGQPIAIVTTVLEPFNANPNKVLSFQTFMDSANIDCSPSYGMLFGASPETATTQSEVPFMVMALKNGYYVVSPDYEGLNAALFASKQGGKAILDSIRAALNSKEITGINEDAKVAMWGYSAGAMASGFAAGLQPTYAPELKSNLVGAALGGSSANITSIIEKIDGSVFAGFTPNAFMGLANEYPDFGEFIRNEMDPKQAEIMDQGLTNCLAPALLNGMGTKFFTGDKPVFPRGFEIFDDPIVSDVLNTNSLLYVADKLVPQIPMFMYHGTLDQFVPIIGARGVYKIWCEQGIKSLEFAEDITSGHITQIIAGAPAAFTWIEQRFKGKPPVEGCVHNARFTNFLYPDIEDATFEYLQGYYDTFLQSPLGPYIQKESGKELADSK